MSEVLAVSETESPKWKRPPGWVLGAIAHFVGAAFLLLCAFLIGRDTTNWAGDKSPFEIAGGLAALYVAIWSVWLLNKRTINSERTLQHAQLAEQAGRFQKGSDMLASEKVASRIAGVILLREIALLNPSHYYNAVLNLLIVFAEEQTKGTWEAYLRLSNVVMEMQRSSPDWNDAVGPTPEDVVAAVNAIGRIRGIPGRSGYERGFVGDARLRIRRVILSNCTIRGGNFDHMEIDSGCFHHVLFTDCRLQDTVIPKLNVIDTWFKNCEMTSVNMQTERMIDDGAPARRLTFSKCTIQRATIEAMTEKVTLDNCRRDSSTKVQAAEIVD